MPQVNEPDRLYQPLLRTLEQLLALPAVDLRTALNQASQLIVQALHADKVDAFLFEPLKNTLRAIGSSDTPLSQIQLAHGLEVMPLANRGSVVEVYTSGKSWFFTEEDLRFLHAHADPERLRHLLENLIGSAVRHSPRGRPVLVEVRAEVQPETAQRQALVEVTDQGPGPDRRRYAARPARTAPSAPRAALVRIRRRWHRPQRLNKQARERQSSDDGRRWARWDSNPRPMA